MHWIVEKKYRINQFSTMLDGDTLFLNCTSSIVLFFGSGDNYWLEFFFFFGYLALFLKYFSLLSCLQNYSSN